MSTSRREPASPGHLRAALAAGVLLCACAAGGGGDGGPQPASVAPDRGWQGAPTAIAISGDFRARVFTDYGDGAASTVDARFGARLGGARLRDVRLRKDGSLTAVVPEDLVPGWYDLVVTAPDGREGMLARAFRVVATLEASELVSSFRVDVTGPVQATRPFDVTVTAVDGSGTAVTAFNGTATLSDTSGTAVPATVGPFTRGVWTGRAEIRSPGATTITVTGSGAAGSATTNVQPAAAGRLAFLSSPLEATAGACAGPVAVEVRDRFGFPTLAAQATDVSLAASESIGLAAFSDATCTAGGVRIAAGAASGNGWIRATRAGAYSLDATAAGLVTASQGLSVAPGPPSSLAWDAIPSPQVQDTPFPTVLRAVDGFGNAAPTFTGTAALTVAPEGSLACSRACSSDVATVPFVGGEWSGEVIVGGRRGVRTLGATAAGLASGTSNAFEILGGAASPPIARFTAAPVAVRLAGSAPATVSVDASRSSDWDSLPDELAVSWDCTGAATTAPGTPSWTAWTATKTATCTFSSAGTYGIRLAVRDAQGLVSYASAEVVVLSAGSTTELCVVDTAADVDDLGGTTPSSCATKGTDGALSLAEAIRIANARPGARLITFSGAMTILGTGSYTVSDADALEIRAPVGVTLVGKAINIDTTSSVLITGLELRNQPTPVLLRNGSNVRFQDVSMIDMAGISVSGSVNLTLRRVRMIGCTQTCVQMPPSNSSPGKVVVLHSELRGGGSGVGIDLARCNPSQVASEIQSTLFAGFATAVRITCLGSIYVRNDTFAGNGTGIAYGSGGTGHDLRNNVFLGQTVATTAGCGAAQFAAKSNNLEYGGVTDAAGDCVVATDPGYISADPLFVFPRGADYRLQQGSPAIDRGIDLGLDLNDVGAAARPPGLYCGTAPDLGGRETCW